MSTERVCPQQDQRSCDRRIQNVVALIEKNPLLIKHPGELCRLVNMSTSRFYQLFKAEMRIGPASYVKTRKLALAESLLKTTFLSVKEISARAGFNDLSHFVRDFKRRNGVSPRNYRALFHETAGSSSTRRETNSEIEPVPRSNHRRKIGQ
jgi:AraC-like DNA-binding protein